MRSNLTQYYLHGILPAFVIFTVISISFHLIAGSFFVLGFIWPYSYYTPGIKEKLIENPKKLSLLSISIQTHDLLFSKNKYKLFDSLIRGIFPICFIMLLSVISFSYLYLWTIVGWAYFEVYFVVKKRIEKVDY